ncbi:MAG TPA: PLP-dependent aminotransferase family protein [Bryobacteraceae bacterium]
MPKVKGSLELPLRARSAGQSLTDWLYEELRSAILEGRSPPRTRLPATRDFAVLHGLSRGTVVQVFERLHSEGYLSTRVGAGTWVSDRVTPRPPSPPQLATPPDYIRRAIAAYKKPKAFAGLRSLGPARPFRIGGVDLQEFPSKLWAGLAARRARNTGSSPLNDYDPRGYRPLREAIAHYLGSSRGIGCTAGQVILVSGVQQALDLLARLLLKPGAKVWMEDPGYFGSRIAFESVAAKIIPVPVDSEGIRVSIGRKMGAAAAGAYVTPAHQFPLGPAMSLGRRMELLKWAANAGAFIIEDDYDSEFRFEGRPIPALMSLDRSSSVILVGSFSKMLFPSLRIGYIVAPPALADFVVAFRARTDFRAIHFEQAVLADFMEHGHLGRHLRRMREIYSARYAALREAAQKHLAGVLEVRNVHCGLYTAAHLKNGMSSSEAEKAASAAGVETLSLDRCTLAAADPKGLLLGFASFNEAAIREGVRKLARALAE